MTLTTELSPDFYEAQISSLQGEVDALQRDNDMLQMQLGAALDHAKEQAAECQRYRSLHMETSQKYITQCKELSQMRTELASALVALDEVRGIK